MEKMLGERVKWRLWHGHVANTLMTLDWMSEDYYCEEKSDIKREQLYQACSNTTPTFVIIGSSFPIMQNATAMMRLSVRHLRNQQLTRL